MSYYITTTGKTPAELLERIRFTLNEHVRHQPDLVPQELTILHSVERVLWSLDSPNIDGWKETEFRVVLSGEYTNREESKGANRWNHHPVKTTGLKMTIDVECIRKGRT